MLAYYQCRLLSSRLTAGSIISVCRPITQGRVLKAMKLGTAPAVQKTGLLPSVHWTIERIIATGMLPLYPIALYMDTPIMNFIVVTAVSMHSYWGFDGVIKDYAFERRYGPALMPILRTLWKIMSGCGFAGLLYFNFNDVGFITAVKKLWAL
ncbi:Succinate dehydrogenase [ubiquinone] cytochrome b small subunit isoform 2 [Schistosoma japonicum]|nr:Succinate dehydrogenase [ubiquinone] cytochrome b small subunit isoform 2 [Schistosoma japonicum]